MIIALDYHGTLIGNPACGACRAREVVAELRDAGDITMIWTAEPDCIEGIWVTRVDGIWRKPELPRGVHALIDDDERLLRCMARLHPGMRTIHASRLGELPALLQGEGR